MGELFFAAMIPLDLAPEQFDMFVQLNFDKKFMVELPVEFTTDSTGKD